MGSSCAAPAIEGIVALLMQCAHMYIYGVEVNSTELLKKIFSHNAMKEKVDLNGRELKKYLGNI